MKKIVIHGPGGYERLQLEEAPDLTPKSKEVVVEIYASGVNYADVVIRWGLYESAKKYVGWPITPGFEFAGIVSKVGKDATAFREGDHVFGVNLFNAYATQISVPEHQLFPLPKFLSFSAAAALPAVFMTAYHALCQLVIVRPHSKILVHSAAGGVGGSLIQVARIKGWDAIGIVGSSHKVDAVRALGARHVIDKSKSDWYLEAQKLAPSNYDVVLDANGFSTLKQSYTLVRPTGKLICYGFHSMLPKKGGRVNPINLVLGYLRTPRFNPFQMTTENRSLVCFNLSFLFEFPELMSQGISEMVQWLSTGELQLPQISEYPLEKVAEAHQALESGKTVGKLVLVNKL